MRAILIAFLFPTLVLAAAPEILPGTQRLAVPEAEVPSMMIGGIDRFLTKQTEVAANHSEKLFESRTPEQRRERLIYLLGIREKRPEKVEMELVGTIEQPALVGRSDLFQVHAVRWRAFDNVYGEGLLLQPTDGKSIANVIAIPDADQLPEQIVGLLPGVPEKSQYARRLAEQGCQVLVPVLISRDIVRRSAPGRPTGPEISNREFVFRTSFESGRHVIGYELLKVMAAVDWFKSRQKDMEVGVFGWGEGGMLALYAAAVDRRLEAVGISGYFGKRDALWKEPIERTVRGRVAEFSDAQLITMTAYGSDVTVEMTEGPKFKSTGKMSAPGELVDPVDAKPEWTKRFGVDGIHIHFLPPNKDEGGGVARDSTLIRFLQQLTGMIPSLREPAKAPAHLRDKFDSAPRQKRQLDELIAHSQSLIASSQETRKQFMQPLAKIASPEKYEAALQPFRDRLYNDLLGKFDLPLLPPNVRTRKIYDTEKFIGYEVMLDVFPEVIAYGILLLPKDLKEGEKRAVVVCQHGLEGTPQQTITGNSHYYHDFAAKLAERGYITFSPQNPYILGENFRVLSRKAWPIGKTMWSIIIPQHQQILNFLKALPGVDPKRIGFYGLSYGGKTAMRVPAVLSDYCLSICSGDFNEWVAKIVSTTAPFSYVFTHEYEIYEFDLASTFNHAEMAALIAPRPFMVERGHYDGVSSDEYVAWEFAKVRRLYQGQLKIPDRCAIEWFDGPHMINAKGTFEFLDNHLHPERK